MFPASRCRIASFSFPLSFFFCAIDGIVFSQIFTLTIPRSQTRPVFTHSSFSFLHGLSAWSMRKLGGRRDHIIRKYMYVITWHFRRSPQISRRLAESMELTVGYLHFSCALNDTFMQIFRNSCIFVDFAEHNFSLSLYQLNPIKL